LLLQRPGHAIIEGVAGRMQRVRTVLAEDRTFEAEIWAMSKITLLGSRLGICTIKMGKSCSYN
jgi:hypothetical protein